MTGAATGTTAQAPLTMNAGGSATVQIGTSISMAATKYGLSVQATRDSFSATIPITVTISVSNFTMTSAQSALKISAGATGQFSASVTHHGVFNSAVSLAWAGLPTGVTASLSKSTLAAPGDGTVATTFNVAYSTTPGTYTVTLTGSGGGIRQSVPLTLTIGPGPSLTLKVTTPVSPMVVKPGQSYTLSIICAAVTGNFSSPLALSITGAPAGITTKLSASTMTTTSVVQLQITAAQSITAASFTLNLTASSGGFTTSTPIPVTID